MRILKVEPGKAPYAKEMEEGLKAIQREVEGRPEAPCSCKTESRKRNLFPPFVRHDLLCGLWFTNGIHQPRSKAKRKTL